MTVLLTLLCGWTLIAWLWWLIALSLVRSPRPKGAEYQPDQPPTITLFKPLPATEHPDEQARLVENLVSWIHQMDQHCEMLLGCHQQQLATWQTFVENMRQQYPQASLKLISHAAPLAGAANPKIAWIQILAKHAVGELWFLSDADIHAARDSIASLRADLTQSPVTMVTCPYIIDHAESAPAVLDTLFVNLEFYPGVRLLELLNAIAFGFGSGMLFRAEDFRQRADTPFLATCLADDFHLGQMLQPVKLASTRLSTRAAARRWKPAIAHYFRWQKTLRWNQPLGFASQLAILPITGWLLTLLFFPGQAKFWAGLTASLAVDWLAALTICRALPCKLSTATAWSIPLWSLTRSITFIGCWLPIPVVWRGQWWNSPHKPGARRD